MGVGVGGQAFSHSGWFPKWWEFYRTVHGVPRQHLRTPGSESRPTVVSVSDPVKVFFLLCASVSLFAKEAKHGLFLCLRTEIKSQKELRQDTAGPY